MLANTEVDGGVTGAATGSLGAPAGREAASGDGVRSAATTRAAQLSALSTAGEGGRPGAEQGPITVAGTSSAGLLGVSSSASGSVLLHEDGASGVNMSLEMAVNSRGLPTAENAAEQPSQSRRCILQ